MKIAFLMKSPFYFGGEQRVVSVIAGALAEHGHEVTILYTAFDALEDRSLYQLHDEVKICGVEGKNQSNIIKRIVYKAIKKVNQNTNLLKKSEHLLENIYYKRDRKFIDNLCKKINEEQFDVVVGVAGYYSVLLGMLKTKLTCKVYGWQHSCYDAYFRTKNRYYWHQDAIFQKYLKCLDRYIVLTNYDKNNMENHFRIQCQVIPNPKSFSSVEKSNLNKKNFLALGRIEKAKGMDLLIDSFHLFAEKDKEWNLIIVGNGSQEKIVKEKIQKYRLQNRVTMYPFTKDVKKYMLQSSVFLFPSIWEGFGLVILEAFETGLPVIAYELEPFKEIIENEKDGFLIPKFETEKYAQCMLDIISNPDKLKEISQNAIQKANQYSIENIVTQWEKIL